MKETQVSIQIAYIASNSLFKYSKHDNKRIVLSLMNDVSNYLSLNVQRECKSELESFFFFFFKIMASYVLLNSVKHG